MEIAGLAIGVAALFSVCMDVLERIDSYRDFGIDSGQTVARFEADKRRLQTWAEDVGISDSKIRDTHHNRLDRPEIVSVVKTILYYIRELFDATEHTQAQLRLPANVADSASLALHGPFRSDMKAKRKAHSSISKRSGIGWALKSKGKFTTQVKQFEELVDKLYALVPPIADSERTQYSNLQWDCIEKGGFLKTLDIFTNFQNEFRVLLEDARRNNMAQARKAVDEWLNVALIFQNPAYIAWVSADFPDEKAKFLWLCGPAGHGKTILCAKIVQYLRDSSPSTLTYFFSSNHVQAGGQPEGILRFWVSEMVRINQDALKLVRGSLQESEGSRVASQAEIWTVFKIIVSQIPGCTFVVDGLDEYNLFDECIAEFLANLKKAVAGTTTRILVASRDESDIRSELAPRYQNSVEQTLLQCRISKDNIQADIALYSKHTVDKKLSKKTDESTRKELAIRLAQKSDGMFLWIKMQQEQLRGWKSTKALQDDIENMPSGLHSTYKRNWNRIKDQPDRRRKSRAIAILRWVIYALRPLTVLEMTEALIVKPEHNVDELDLTDLPDSIDDEYINTEITDLCGSLVEVRAADPEQPLGFSTIHLVHISVKEYLLSVLPSYEGYGSVIASFPIRPLTTSNFPKHFESFSAPFPDDIAVKIEPSTPLYYATLFNLTPTVEFLCSLGRSDLDFVGGQYGTALQAACAKGHAIAFEALIGCGADVNAKGGGFGTALNAASGYNRVDMVKLLVTQGASLNLQDPFGRTPLYTACLNGHSETVTILLEAHADLSVTNKYGWTPINAAAESGHLEVVRLLLDHKADPNVPNKSEITPLFGASLAGHVEIVRLLLNHKAELNVPDKNGWTPINAAAESGHLEVVRLLLDHKADLNVPSKIGWTPLYNAARKGHAQIVTLLLDNGAHSSTMAVVKALNVAAFNGHINVLQIFLENHYADKFLTDDEGRTALHLAARGANLEAFNYLIDAGFDVTAQDGREQTILHSAASSASLSMVGRVSQLPYSPSTPKSLKWSPLHWACRSADFEVLRTLSDAGFRTSSVVTLEPPKSWTPLDIAVYHRNKNLVSDQGHLLESLPWSEVLPCGIVSIDRELKTPLPASQSSFDPQNKVYEGWCDGCLHVSLGA
ncbi:hypothetical protein MMC17_004085 [Xylographa soralifera]|nr:hypothetical protein [Xylographa soralifera]